MRLVFRKPYRYILLAVVAIVLAPAVILLVLRVFNPPITAYMSHVGAELRQKNPDASLRYEWVDLDQIASCMPLAVAASEDQTFPTNHGFVWSAIEKALRHNADGGRVRGASTITQQTAKNLFFWPAKSYIRKGLEAYITIWMDMLWPKRRIMEVYLNVAQFSSQDFGVQAAARHLFGTDSAHLSNSQCAALAAVLPAPEKYNAASPSAYVAGRIRWILRQMRQLGPHYLDNAIGG